MALHTFQARQCDPPLENGSFLLTRATKVDVVRQQACIMDDPTS